MAKLNITLPDATESSQDVREEKITVGRDPGSTISISDTSVSTNHAEIIFENGKHKLIDLGSTNGTKVNGSTVEAPVELAHGDNILFGQVAAVYLGDGAEQAAKPLPEQTDLEAEVGATSSKPVSFTNASPFAVKKRNRDPFGVAAMAAAAIAWLLLALAVFAVYNLTPPPSV